MIELNKIYCENCLDTMRRMPDGFVDLTVTSPPYDSMRDYNNYEFKFDKIAKELSRVTKAGGIVAWVVNDETRNGCESLTAFKQAIFFVESCRLNLFDTMFFKKKNPTPNDPRIGRYVPSVEYMFILCKGQPKVVNLIREKSIHADKIIKTTNPSQRKVNGETRIDRIEKRLKPVAEYKVKSNVWEYTLYFNSESNFHPATFPESLARDHIYSWSNKGDTVYDPFGGSGTVAKMAHLMKRNWILSEISQEYVDLAQKRIEPYLRQTTLEL